MLKGSYYRCQFDQEEYNSDCLITYKKRFPGVDFSVSGGGNYMTKNYQDLNVGMSSSGTGLTIPGLYRVSNIPQSSTHKINFSSRKKIYSLYGMASIGVKDQLYVDITGRNDWSSTLPVFNRSFFYPSVSVSWLINETLYLPSAIPFMQCRVGLADIVH